MKKDEAIRLIEEMHEDVVTNELELRALTIEKGEARTKIERLEANLADKKKDVAHLYLDLQNSGQHVQKLLAQIKDLECRPTLAQQGRMLDDINMLQGRINASNELVSILKAENKKLRAIAIDAENERIESDLKAHGRELKLERETKEAEQKLRFWKGWGIVIGMMIAFALGTLAMAAVWNIFS